MKKTIIWIVGLLLCSFAAYALEGNVKVETFKVYVADENQDIDWSDNSFNANAGTDVQLSFKLFNNYSSSFDVVVRGILRDIKSEDIDRSKTISISSQDTKSTTLDYFIPSDTRQDTYDLDITYKYTINSTNYEHSKTLTVRVKRPELDTNEVLRNLTQALVYERDRSNDLIGVAVNLSTTAVQLGECRAKEGELTTKGQLYEEYKGKYDNLSAEKDIINEAKQACEGQKSAMFSMSQIEEFKFQAKADQKGEDDKLLIGVVIIGGIIWWFNRRQKRVGGSGEGVSLMGAKWK